MIPGVSLAGWVDRRGIHWARAPGPRAEPGWLFSERVAGTICFERGRFACYRLNNQLVPCRTFDTLHEAADFMVEARA